MGKGGRKNRRRADFHYRVDDEPHAQRRTEILKKYPEVKKLYGFEPLTKYIAGATVFMQLALAIGTRHLGWAKWLGVIYCVGATANHSLFLAIHELAHNLGAKTINGNKYIAMMANIPICIAYSVTFKPYHMAHHRNQGVEGVDTDIPSAIEGLLVTGTALNYWDHTARKAIFMFFQIFGYALRPMFTKPDLVPVDKWIILNWLVCLSCDAALVAAFGPAPLFYLLLSTFFAGSIHPTAGHFIAEHYARRPASPLRRSFFFFSLTAASSSRSWTAPRRPTPTTASSTTSPTTSASTTSTTTSPPSPGAACRSCEKSPPSTTTTSRSAPVGRGPSSATSSTTPYRPTRA